MKAMHVGINAARARSGGAQAHLIGIFEFLDPSKHGFDKITLWSYDALLKSIQSRNWLAKKETSYSDRSIFAQLAWERFSLAKQAKELGVDVMLNVDAGTVCTFSPAVTMSRDMLAFEAGEASRFGIGRERWRQAALKYLQCRSLTKSDGSIFLTEYAKKVIQAQCGAAKCATVIPHGVAENFRMKPRRRSWRTNAASVQVTYVSPVWLFKHQWNVVEAIGALRSMGISVTLRLVGGGEPKALERLNKQISISDPKREFVDYIGPCGHKDLPKHLQETDVFIFASTCENMPNSLLEAMAAGLPIACSNRGPMPEILGAGGEYFDPEIPESIQEAVMRIIMDPTYGRRLSQIAYNLSEKYSWSRCADETMSFLEYICTTS